MTEYLVKKYGFVKFYPARSSESDPFSVQSWDGFTCMLRIHDVHYLFYSDNLKYFTLGLKYEKPKGQAGGGFHEWNKIMIPILINTKSDIDLLLKGFKITKK